MTLDSTQFEEINEARNTESITRRPSVPALENIMFSPFTVLDHGFVRVIDYMGDDSSIVQAARVSYGKGTRRLQEDTALIRYMKRHDHNTPFEMCEIKFHIKLPIFVARQWIRHRTANVNEYSARYSILDKEFYIPEPDQLAVQSTINRQGRGEIIDADQAAEIQRLLRQDADTNYQHYIDLLNDPSDKNHDPYRPMLARELARMNLTLNTYTQWYWKVNLHNLFHFLGLRADVHAQYEIRVYADKILEIVKEWVPIATQAFIDYHHEAVKVSRMETLLIRDLVNGAMPANIGSDLIYDDEKCAKLMKAYGLSKREIQDFVNKFIVQNES